VQPKTPIFNEKILNFGLRNVGIIIVLPPSPKVDDMMNFDCRKHSSYICMYICTYENMYRGNMHLGV
jgi:hypothetical protein